MYQSLLKLNLKKLGIFKNHSGYTCHFVDLSIPTTGARRWHFNILWDTFNEIFFVVNKI